MSSCRLDPAVAADAAAVTAVVVALESSLYGQTAFSQADLEDEWSDVDLERDARVVRDGDRIVGHGAVREAGELWRAEGYVHPDALGRGIGRLIATGLEEDAARRGARRIQNGVFEADSAARRLLESLGYGAVRVFRELRIELAARPPSGRPSGAPERDPSLPSIPASMTPDIIDLHGSNQVSGWNRARGKGNVLVPRRRCAQVSDPQAPTWTLSSGDGGDRGPLRSAP